MIASFYGPGLFPVKEAVKKETERFLVSNKNALVQRFNLEDEAQLDDFVNTLKSKSFFGEKKLIIAANIFFNGKTSEKICSETKKYLAGSDQDLNFIFYEQGSAAELKKRDSQLFDFLTKYGQEHKEITALKGAQLEKWLVEKFETAGLKIKTSVARKLISFVLSQERLSQEIDKLIAYKSYAKNKTGNEVGNDDISNLVIPDASFNNFSLTDALSQKNKAKAVVLLNQYLSEGGDMGSVLGLFVYQLRVLLKIKSLLKKSVAYGNLASLTKLHPFVIKKAYGNSQGFELEELKRMYQELSNLDTDFKDGRNDLTTGLFCFLLKAC